MSSKKIEYILFKLSFPFFRCLYLTHIIQLAFARVSVDETFVLWCQEVLFVTLQSIFVDTVRRSWYLHNLYLRPVIIYCINGLCQGYFINYWVVDLHYGLILTPVNVDSIPCSRLRGFSSHDLLWLVCLAPCSSWFLWIFSVGARSKIT